MLFWSSKHASKYKMCLYFGNKTWHLLQHSPIFRTCLQPNVLYLVADNGHGLPGLSERMLSWFTIKSLCFVFQTVCISNVFAKSKHVQPVCKCVCFLYPSQACVRIRIKGDKAPELLLELQDDDRTQTFFTQVKSAQQQGKTSLSVGSLKQQTINYLFTHLTFIDLGWITPLTDFLCILAIHTGREKLTWLTFLKSDPPLKVPEAYVILLSFLHFCSGHVTHTPQLNEQTFLAVPKYKVVVRVYMCPHYCVLHCSTGLDYFYIYSKQIKTKKCVVVFLREFFPNCTFDVNVNCGY